MLTERQRQMVALLPHLNHVPATAGGVGRSGVRAFYRDRLVGKFFPPDVKMINVSRTVGEAQVVEEIWYQSYRTAVSVRKETSCHPQVL